MTTSHVDHWLQMIGILKAHNNNLESDSQYKNKFSGLLGDLMRLAPDLKIVSDFIISVFERLGPELAG